MSAVLPLPAESSEQVQPLASSSERMLWERAESLSTIRMFLGMEEVRSRLSVTSGSVNVRPHARALSVSRLAIERDRPHVQRGGRLGHPLGLFDALRLLRLQQGP